MSDKDKDQQDHHGPVSKALDVLAYPIAIATGGYYGHTTISDNLYEIIKKDKTFEPHRETHHHELGKVFENAATTKAELPREHKRYTAEIKSYLKDHGYNNTLDYFGALQHNQKINVIVGMATVSALMLGATFAIADNKTIQKLFADKDPSQAPAK